MKRLYALEILSKFYLPEKSLKVDENQFHKHRFMQILNISNLIALFMIEFT